MSTEEERVIATPKEANSDGFETASDGDIEDEEDANNSNSNNAAKIDDPPQEEEDSIEKQQLNQEKLEQANVAKLEGNKLFAEGQFEEALSQYEAALQVAPENPASVELRSICHSNRGVCFLKMAKYEETVKECSKALELNPTYMKALVRRGEAREKLEQFEEAIADMNKIIELDPANEQAKRNKQRLEPLAHAKREKMKEEMIGKLKEMGNSLLGRFGMSIDNFKTVQDPNTGAYSVQFQR